MEIEKFIEKALLKMEHSLQERIRYGKVKWANNVKSRKIKDDFFDRAEKLLRELNIERYYSNKEEIHLFINYLLKQKEKGLYISNIKDVRFFQPKSVNTQNVTDESYLIDLFDKSFYIKFQEESDDFVFEVYKHKKKDIENALSFLPAINNTYNTKAYEALENLNSKPNSNFNRIMDEIVELMYIENKLQMSDDKKFFNSYFCSMYGLTHSMLRKTISAKYDLSIINLENFLEFMYFENLLEKGFNRNSGLLNIAQLNILKNIEKEEKIKSIYINEISNILIDIDSNNEKNINNDDNYEVLVLLMKEMLIDDIGLEEIDDVNKMLKELKGNDEDYKKVNFYKEILQNRAEDILSALDRLISKNIIMTDFKNNILRNINSIKNNHIWDFKEEDTYVLKVDIDKINNVIDLKNNMKNNSYIQKINYISNYVNVIMNNKEVLFYVKNLPKFKNPNDLINCVINEINQKNGVEIMDKNIREASLSNMIDENKGYRIKNKI